MKDSLDAAEAFHSLGEASRAMAILDSVLAGISPDEAVTGEGARDPKNIQLRDAAFANALRYHIGRQTPDAERARELLLQFADKMSQWPIKANRRGTGWRPQDATSLYTDYAACGLWGGWYHLDLLQGFPLLRAYDLIYPTLSDEDRKRIENDVFDYQVRFLLRWEPLFHNTDVYEIEGLVRFGLVLKRPDYVHTAVEHLRKLYYIGFSPDGFWQEATPAYHRQVASPLAGLPNLLKDYSDPPGWRDPESGLRYDHLRLDEEFAAHLARMKRSQEKLSLPNGYLLAANDADPDRYKGSEATSSRPELLGTSGFALLGSGDGAEQERVVLNFEGTHGHEHLDGNGLYWYAFGTPVFDETRYRPLAGSGSTRAWSQSTYAHNTVVIDERDQPGRFAKPHRAFGEDDRMQGMISWPLRDSSGGSNHAGDLLLFDGGESEVQAVEVEARKAYRPVAELYRRSVLKVNLGGGASYLVDIFRVKGGQLHDYMLHGALSLPYTAEYSFQWEEAVAKPFAPDSQSNQGGGKDFLQVQASKRVSEPWHVTFSIENGIHTRTWMLAPKGALVRSCSAPAINRKGTAAFVGVRHENDESVFVAVHEAYREGPKIKEARLLVTPADVHGGLAVEIDLGGRKHVVLATSGADQRVSAIAAGGAKVSMRGRLAWLETREEKWTRAILWDGTSLDFGEDGGLKSPQPALEGAVVKTLRREAGDLYDALVVDAPLPAGDALNGSVVHVNFGEELTWSYRVEGIENGEDGESIIRIEHEPGFEIRPGGLAKMLFHPGWGHRGGVKFRLPSATRTGFSPAP